MLWSWEEVQTNTSLEWIVVVLLDGLLIHVCLLIYGCKTWEAYLHSWLILSGSPGRFPESEQDWEATLEQPVSLIWNKAFRAVISLFCCYSDSTLNLSLIYVRWAVNHLTALRQPPFRVEGPSFEPPHFHFYRPHAALQHKIHRLCHLVVWHS